MGANKHNGSQGLFLARMGESEMSGKRQSRTARVTNVKGTHMEKVNLELRQKGSFNLRIFGEAGFTMVELVVTLIFIGIALTALLSSFSTSVVKSTPGR